jgi:hypothetical protein
MGYAIVTAKSTSPLKLDVSVRFSVKFNIYIRNNPIGFIIRKRIFLFIM